MLSLDLTPELIQQLRELSNLFAQQYTALASFSEETKSSMHRYAKISMIGASTRIENAVLTDPEIEWIDTLLTQDGKPTAFLTKKEFIENKLDKDRERSIEEVAGCRGMLELIYDQAATLHPMAETTIRGLHHELMRYYPKAKHYIGRYKVQSNSVVETNHATGETRVVFETAEPGPITEAAMRELVDWYNIAYPMESWTVAIACEFTYRFLAIHPFQDGNGRLGRGLFLLTLLQSPESIISSVAPYLAIDRQIERRKSEYYSVLNRCSDGKYRREPKKYHIEYFLRFMIKILKASLEDIKIYKERCDALQLLSESSRIVLTCFKEHPEIRLSAQQIHEETKLPKRTITYCLSILNKEHFIQKYGQGAGVRYQLIF